MLRFRETELWRQLTFHFRCKKLINELNDYKKECTALRTKVEEDKAVYNHMDNKHVADKEVMAKEIEEMRERHLKLLGECRLAEAHSKATTKFAYDAEKSIQNLQAEKAHLKDIIEGLKKDFEAHKAHTPAKPAVMPEYYSYNDNDKELQDRIIEDKEACKERIERDTEYNLDDYILTDRVYDESGNLIKAMITRDPEDIAKELDKPLDIPGVHEELLASAPDIPLKAQDIVQHVSHKKKHRKGKR